MANKKVNTNDLPQLRLHKALSSDQCVNQLIIFLHCPTTLEIWQRLFHIAHVVRVPLKGIAKMLGISFKSFGNLAKEKTL